MDTTSRKPSPIGTGRKTLLVDANESMRSQLEVLLRKRGHDLTVCETGTTAWVEFQQHLHAFVIIGPHLGNMSGLDLVERIHSIPDADRCTLALLIDAADVSGQEDAFAKGATCFIAVPTSQTILERQLPVLESLARDRLTTSLTTGSASVSESDETIRDELARRLHQEEELTAVCRLLRGDEQLADVLPEALRRFLAIAGATSACLVTNTGENDTPPRMRCTFPTGERTKASAYPFHGVAYSPALSRWQRTLGFGHVISDATADCSAAEKKILSAAGIERFAALPVMVQQGWYGFLYVERRSEQPGWGPADLRLLRIASDALAAFLDLRQSAEHTQQAEGHRKTANILEEQLKTLRDEKASLEVKLKEATSAADQESDKRAKQFDALQSDLESTRAREKELNDNLQSLKNNKTDLEQKLAYEHEKQQSLASDLSDLMTRHEHLQTAYTEKQETLQALKKRLTEAETAQQEQSRLLDEAIAGSESERERAEATWRAVMDATLNVVLVLDTAGTVIAANASAAQLYDATPADLAGQCYYDLCPAESRDARRDLFGEVIASRQARRTDLVTDGRTFESTVYPVLSPNGEVERIVIFKRDQTERIAAEEAMVRRERLAAVGTLAGGVSHEFNNLNTGILGFADLLLEEPSLDPSVRRRIEMIRKGAARARDIAKKLLAFARADESTKKAADLNEVVSTSVDLVSRMFEVGGVQLDIDFSPVPAATMNSSEIGQVVLNLLVNALHAVRGMDTKKVELFTGTDKDTVYVDVKDTGCGIPPDVLPNIFNPFFTTKGGHAPTGSVDGDVKGSGLGLSVSDKIVRGHNGKITVTSHPGNGSTFRVSLPMTDATPREKECSESDSSAQWRLLGARILILDDEDVVVQLLRDVLQPEGCKVTVLEAGEEALRRAASGVFDLAIVDLSMPSMSGREFMSRMSKIPESKRPECIVITGRTDIQADELHDLSVASTLLKPFTKREILKHVRGALSKQRQHF